MAYKISRACQRHMLICDVYTHTTTLRLLCMSLSYRMITSNICNRKCSALNARNVEHTVHASTQANIQTDGRMRGRADGRLGGRTSGEHTDGWTCDGDVLCRSRSGNACSTMNEARVKQSSRARCATRARNCGCARMRAKAMRCVILMRR